MIVAENMFPRGAKQKANDPSCQKKKKTNINQYVAVRNKSKGKNCK